MQKRHRRQNGSPRLRAITVWSGTWYEKTLVMQTNDLVIIGETLNMYALCFRMDVI